jgi:hypothetical protein
MAYLLYLRSRPNSHRICNCSRLLSSSLLTRSNTSLTAQNTSPDNFAWYKFFSRSIVPLSCFDYISSLDEILSASKSAKIKIGPLWEKMNKIQARWLLCDPFSEEGHGDRFKCVLRYIYINLECTFKSFLEIMRSLRI